MPSTHFWRLRTAVRRSIVRQETGLRGSLDLVIGDRSLLFCGSSSFHSLSSSTPTELHVLLRLGTVSAATSKLVIQRRNISVVGALSHTLPTPSVSRPAFQICDNPIDCTLAEPGHLMISSKFRNTPMASCGSRAVFTGSSLDNLTSRQKHLSLWTNNAHIFYSNRSFESCCKASMSLKNYDKPNWNVIYGYFMYNVAKRWCNSQPFKESEPRHFHGTSSTGFSAGTAPDVFFDNSACEEQVDNSTDSSELKISLDKTLKLLSGSCYLPHPDKEGTGGEDAHFIFDEQAIGVADGVGDWAYLGVDSGLYSRELMSYSVTAVKEEPEGSIDPARVLEKAHSRTKAKGSSTACIIALTDAGIHAINLGDSGFMVVRDGCTVFRSPVQQRNFNFTYQLQSGINGDLPSSGQVFTISVAPGDVIIAGTDGLFDNLYNNEIKTVVVQAMRAGLGPEVTAKKIAALARQRAQDKERQTPFATAAQDAGIRYYGGKLDDITVVVSFIRSSSSV